MTVAAVGQSPFSLLKLGYGQVDTTTAAGLGVGDPGIADALTLVSTSMDVLSAFASPDAAAPLANPADQPLPLQGVSVLPVGTVPLASAPAGSAAQAYASAPPSGSFLAGALLYDSFA